MARYGVVRDCYDHRDYVKEYRGNKISSHRHTEVDLRRGPGLFAGQPEQLHSKRCVLPISLTSRNKLRQIRL